MDARLEALNTEIKEFYNSRRVTNRLPNIKRSNLKDGDFPELKGNGVKAANTRALLPYVCGLQSRAANRNLSRNSSKCCCWSMPCNTPTT